MTGLAVTFILGLGFLTTGAASTLTYLSNVIVDSHGTKNLLSKITTKEAS